MDQNDIEVSAGIENGREFFSLKRGIRDPYKYYIDNPDEFNFSTIFQIASKNFDSANNIPIITDVIQSFRGLCMATFCLDANKDGASWDILEQLNHPLFDILKFGKKNNTHKTDNIPNGMIKNSRLYNSPSFKTFQDTVIAHLNLYETFSRNLPRIDYSKKYLKLKNIYGITELEGIIVQTDRDYMNQFFNNKRRVSSDARNMLYDYYVNPTLIKKLFTIGNALDSAGLTNTGTFELIEIFPYSGINLSIDVLAYKLLGYNNCSLYSTKCVELNPKKHPFLYELNINDTNIIRNDCNKDDPNRTEYYIGNIQKNIKLEDITVSDEEKALLITVKSMGDRLQVFMVFIIKQLFSDLYPEEEITITTGDLTVLFFCILFKISCVYFSTKQEIIYIDEEEEKFYKLCDIKIFRPSNLLPSTSPFNHKKFITKLLKEEINNMLIKQMEQVKESQLRFVRSMHELKENNQEIYFENYDFTIGNVFIRNEPVIFPDSFYDYLINYSKQIIDYISIHFNIIQKGRIINKIQRECKGKLYIPRGYIEEKCQPYMKELEGSQITFNSIISYNETTDKYLLKRLQKMQQDSKNLYFYKDKNDKYELVSIFFLEGVKYYSQPKIMEREKKLREERQRREILREKRLHSPITSPEISPSEETQQKQLVKKRKRKYIGGKSTKLDNKWVSIIKKYLKKENINVDYDDDLIRELLEDVDTKEVIHYCKDDNDKEISFDAKFNLFHEILDIYFKIMKEISKYSRYFFIDFNNIYFKLDHSFVIENGRNYHSPLLYLTLLKLRLIQDYEYIDLEDITQLTPYLTYLQAGIEKIENYKKPKERGEPGYAEYIKYKEIPIYIAADQYVDGLIKDLKYFEEKVIFKKGTLDKYSVPISNMHSGPFISYSRGEKFELTHANLPLVPVHAGSRRRITKQTRKRRPRLRTTHKKHRHNPQTRKRLKKPYRG